MKNIKNLKCSRANFCIFVLLILSFISNLFFYRKSKKLEITCNYISNISRSITIAAHENSIEILTPKLSPQDLDYLINTFEKIQPKIEREYTVKNYIAIQYKNDSTLMIKVTKDKEGNFLIQDMFLLDDNIYDKLKYDTNYSNL